jgi:pilin isopeptide linkage protein/LPXTG-motif cell wall-anchored protein
MSAALHKAFVLLLAISIVFSTFVFSGSTVHAAIKMNLGTVTVSGGGNTVNLSDGGNIPLKAGVTYTLNLNYSIPTALQGKDTYIKITLGDGLYYKSLSGATFSADDINDSSFQSLVQAPDSTPKYYGYPAAESARSHTGTIIYKTKADLNSVSNSMICFAVDDAYENEDSSQVLENAISVSVGSDQDAADESITSNVTAQDAYGYSFWTTVGSEQIGTDGETDELSTYTYNTASDKSLTKAGTKTTVKITYPSYATLKSLEETSVYKKAGKVVSTETEGDNTIATVEWDEPGSYSGGCTFKPHISVTGDEGKKFNVIISNFSKSIINEETGRTSGSNKAVLTVNYTPGVDPSAKVGGINVLDFMPNWSLKKYDTYNVRLGGYTLRNNGTADSNAKTVEINPDTDGTAIVRGVTIPWTGDISNYSSVEWTASDRTSGETAASTAITSPGAYEIKDGKTIYGGTKSGALIKNTSLGLDKDVSITSIKVDIGKIPKGFKIPEGLSDVMYNSNASETTIDGEYYGWSYVACGVYGTWNKGTDKDVKSNLKIYDTGSDSDSGIVTTLRAKSSAPEILNGVGTINKTQVDGGDSFKISGSIDNANWDWNPLQEPVLYVFMPEGFTYDNLTVTNTNATLSEPDELGSFTYEDQTVKVYKYTLDIGEETRGVYQPDFTNKAMNVSMTVSTNKRSRVGTYHINDFLGFSTQDFEDIGAVIKADHWDHSNWNTSKYTEAINKSSISDKVNDGQTMVSLSEKTGIDVKQGYDIQAKASFSVTSAATGETKEYVYDDTSAETKKNTTAIVNKNDTVNLNIAVKNNAEIDLDHCTLFIPLMKAGSDLGKGFMPDGANGFDLSLENVTAPDSFKVQYIKFKSGTQYAVNEAPQSSDYEIVTDPAQADMVMLVSTEAIKDKYEGKVTLKFKVGDDLTEDDVSKRNVITPMLDYDINGNKSTQTKEAAAVAYGDVNPITYTPVKSDPLVSKQITGDTPSEDSLFTFRLTADRESSMLPSGMTQMPMPQGTAPLQTMTVNGNGAGSYEFGDITFTQPGTYVYRITEENTGADGYTYDESVFTVKYVVTADDASRSLKCVRTITKDGETADDVIFSNIYKKDKDDTKPDPEPVTYTPVKSDPPVSKQITGDTPSEDSLFTFRLTADPASSTLPSDMLKMPMPQGIEPLQTMTVSVKGAGSYEFGNITFTQPGTYVYRITEENTGADGYTYDDSVFTVKYVVTADDASRSLKCVRTITKDGETADDVIFTNVYKKDNGGTDNPDNPGKPDDNKSPEKNGGNGSTSDKNSSSGKSGSGKDAAGLSFVKTGDDSAMPVYLIIMIAAAGGAAVAVRRRRKKD